MELEDVIRKGIQEYYQAIDEEIRKSLIGSKILDLQIVKIPNRKTLYRLTIKTNAMPLKDSRYGHIYDTSKIICKVKLL